MTTPDENQGQETPQTQAPTVAPQTATDHSFGETRKAADGEVPPFFGSGTVEAPVAQAAPDVAPTAPASQPSDGGSGSSSEDNS